MTRKHNPSEASHWTHKGYFGKYEIYYNRSKKILTIRTPDGRRVRYTKATEPSKAYAQAIQDIEGWESAEKHNIEEFGMPYHVGRERNPESYVDPAVKTAVKQTMEEFREIMRKGTMTRDLALHIASSNAAYRLSLRKDQREAQMRMIEDELERGRNPSHRSVHTAKWDRCVKDVKTKGGASSPYAVCTAMLGERGSIKAGHRRKNPSGSKKWRVEVFSSGGSKAQARFFFRTQKEAEEFARRKREDTSRAGYNMDVIVLDNERTKNPSGFQLEKTQRLYFMVHAHPHRGGGERLWLTQSGTLSADKGNGARYTSVEVAVARAKAFLKKHRVARKYRFDVCLSD